jgi:hypothetical protein
MVANEVPYKDMLHKVEIPTETWPAHDIRKCHVFHQASKYGKSEKKAVYELKAKFFFDRCLADLFSFSTAYLTRPMVILSVYGANHSFFTKKANLIIKYENESHSYCFGSSIAFIPQKFRVKQAIKAKIKLVVSETVRHFKAAVALGKNKIAKS